MECNRIIIILFWNSFFSSIAISGNESYIDEKRLFKCSLEKNKLIPKQSQ